METFPTRNFLKSLLSPYICRKTCSWNTLDNSLSAQCTLLRYLVQLAAHITKAMRKSAAVIVVDSRSSKRDDTTRIPKGYVALLVGSEAEERILVRLSLLKDPCVSSLLETTAQELGYDQQGILRVPCEAEHFRWIVNEVSKAL